MTLSKRLRRAASMLALAALSLAGCGGGTPQKPAGATRKPLHVALYPYIPDAGGDQYVALLARIEREFEDRNPDIDLVLRPLNQSDGFYDGQQLAQWLTDPPGEGGYDVLEIDTELLGALAKDDLLAPWTPSGTGFPAAALAAVSAAGAPRGVPRWMCGFYVLSRDPAIAGAADFDALMNAVDMQQAPAEHIAGNLVSDWDLSSMYLSAAADTYGTADLAKMLTAPPDATLTGRLDKLAGACAAGGTNHCIDGTFYKEWDLPAQRFAKGEVPAMFGYSERLHVVLANGGDASQIKVGRLPLGPKPAPVAFVDALVRRKGCTAACADAAERFADYLVDPGTYAWVLMSEDAPGAPPRYLLPAREDAYEEPALQKDPFYPALKTSMQGAVPYPNDGIPAAKDTLFQSVCATFPAGAACTP
jgi:thiamine pyridinylase